MADGRLPLSVTEIKERMIISFMEDTSSSKEEAITFLESHRWDVFAAVSDFNDNNLAEATAAEEANVTNPSDTDLRPTVATRTRNPFSKRGADTPCESERNKRRGLAGNKPDDYEEGEHSGRHEQSPSRTTSGSVPAEPKVILTFIVTIWRNGFTVDNGPLYTMEYPVDADFIESVKRLDSPRDLNPEDNQIRHRINLIRRQEEDFSLDSPKFTPFQGVGRTLGGSDSAATEPPASSEALSTTPIPSMSQVVDNPAAPTISIYDTATILQLSSLYSGSRMIVERLEKDEDVDYKDQESDVEMPVQSSSRPIVSAEPELVIRSTITLYRNGFTVDDDPLNTMDDPGDAAFIELIKSLESPRDLNPEDNQVRYRVKLIMRQEEDFNGENQTDLNPEDHQEAPKFTPFQGIGRTLFGSDSAATEPPASSDSLNTTTPPSMNLVVDPAAPTTLIQLTLEDGTRISSRFNTHHTVRDVRSFIDVSRPGGSNDYQLLIMGIPPKPLLDFDQTIEEAGISNSVLIQKY